MSHSFDFCRFISSSESTLRKNENMYRTSLFHPRRFDRQIKANKIYMCVCRERKSGKIINRRFTINDETTKQQREREREKKKLKNINIMRVSLISTLRSALYIDIADNFKLKEREEEKKTLIIPLSSHDDHLPSRILDAASLLYNSLRGMSMSKT